MDTLLRIPTGWRTTAAVLLLGLGTTLPASGQSLAATRIGLLGGVTFHPGETGQVRGIGFIDLQRYRVAPSDEDPGAATIGAVRRYAQSERGTLAPGHGMPVRSAAARTPMRDEVPDGANTGLSFRIALGYGGNTWPPPPESSRDQQFDVAATSAASKTSQEVPDERPEVNHNNTAIGVFDLILPVPAPPKFLLEAFAGAGAGLVFEGEAATPNRYGLEQRWTFLASYGLEVTMRTTQRLDLRVQYRALVFFPGTVSYTSPYDTSFEVDVETIVTSNLMFGIARRF